MVSKRILTLIGFNPARKKWLPYWLKMPQMTVASDAIYSVLSFDDPLESFKGHPRTAGTHGKVVVLGREHNVPLMFTLAQMRYWPAKHLGNAGLEAMMVRRRLQVGMAADITIFDAEKVKDKATYKAGKQGLPTTGIPYVIVNGKLVVKDSKFQKGVWAGQAIRYPVEEKGRFVPASADDHAVTLQRQVRWDVSSRWTLLFFGGGGRVAEEIGHLGSSPTQFAGGAGFRYMIDPESGISIGVDLAGGGDGIEFYVQVSDFFAN